MSSLLNSIRHLLPSNWDSTPSESDDVHLVELDCYTTEFHTVESKLGGITPDRIVRIENPHMWACYQLKKAEYTARLGAPPQEIEMWHATSPKHIISIANDNFNWRLTKRAKFGRGVCFAQSPIYAHNHSTNDGALILVKVLVGNVAKCGQFSYSLKIPPGDCDTTKGTFNHNSIYVKYMDHEFYPEYVAYYTTI